MATIAKTKTAFLQEFWTEVFTLVEVVNMKRVLLFDIFALFAYSFLFSKVMGL